MPALLVLALACATTTSRAAAQSARAAHAVGLFVDQPAILLARDRALVASMPDGAVTVCSHGSGVCRPIRAARPCHECGSGGAVLELDGAAGDVADFPTDRDGILRESQAVSADPRVSALSPYLPRPPEPTPPPTFHLRAERWGFEVALGGGVGLRPEPSVALPSIYGSLAWGIGVDWDREEILQLLFGSVVGVELRARVLPAVLGTSFEQMSVQLGVAPRTLWAPAREPFRLGALYFSIMPELGVITRPDADAAFYFGWSFPVSVAFDQHVGAEVRAWAYAVDDWIEGDEVAWVLGLDAALVVF